MILLEEIDTEFGHITITEARQDKSRIYNQNGCFHSEINADGISTCAYVHVMYSIISQSGARNVLMIGGAGGTLATMLHRIGCHVTVVDINPHAFTIAKRYFQMPDEIECVVEDGWSYLLTNGMRFDAIAIDAFSSDGTVPEQFTTDGFFALMKESLQPAGVVTMNVMVEHDLDLFADRVALAINNAGLNTMLFDWPGRPYRNTVIAGGVMQKMRIDVQKKPEFVREEMLGITCRPPRRKTAFE